MKKSIVARVIAAMLAIILLFTFAACKDNGKKEEKIKLPEKKVAILVAPEAQYPEDYKAAYELAEKYPNNIIVKEYPDSRILVAGDPQIMTISEELAADETVGAIIYARATQYTAEAITKAKAVNSSILTLCIEPEDSIDKLSSLSDLVLCVDWQAAAKDIVAKAKEQGAKYFINFSLNRHISKNNMLAAANGAIKAACEEQGIAYIYDSAQDPIYSGLGGISGAQKYIKEAVARFELNKMIEGADVAIFSTDSSVQSTIIEIANSKGMIYVSPSFPTAYNGVAEVYEATMPEKITDTDAFIKALKEAVKTDGEGKARLCAYNFPLASVMLEGAVHCAFDLLNGTTTAENLAEKVAERVNAAADNKDFAISAYDTVLKNTFKAYYPGYEVIK